MSKNFLFMVLLTFFVSNCKKNELESLPVIYLTDNVTKKIIKITAEKVILTPEMIEKIKSNRNNTGLENERPSDSNEKLESRVCNCTDDYLGFNGSNHRYTFSNFNSQVILYTLLWYSDYHNYIASYSFTFPNVSCSGMTYSLDLSGTGLPSDAIVQSWAVKSAGYPWDFCSGSYGGSSWVYDYEGPF